MSFDPVLEVLGLDSAASPTVPTTYAPTPVRGGLALEPDVLPSTPTTGTLVIDSADGNQLKWWDGSAWQDAGGGAGGIGGTIANTQVAFGSGANTIQGAAEFTYIATGTGVTVAPTFAISGASTPTYSNFTDTTVASVTGASATLTLRPISLTPSITNATSGAATLQCVYIAPVVTATTATGPAAYGIYIDIITGAVSSSVTTVGMRIHQVNATSAGFQGAAQGIQINSIASKATGAYGINMTSVTSTSGAIVYGIYMSTLTAAGSGDCYGLYLTSITGGTNTYGIYQADTGIRNYFGSKTGVGIAATTTSFLTLAASTTAASTLRITHGAAPSSPVDGDVWTTTGGLFVRINGATQTVTTGGITGSGSTNQIAFWNSSSSIAGDGNFVFSTVSGATRVQHVAGTSTATTVAYASERTVIFSGIFTTGPNAGTVTYTTFSGATNTSTVFLASAHNSCTATGTINSAAGVSGSYDLLTVTPGGNVGAISFAGVIAQGTVTSAANARFGSGNLYGSLSSATFNTANTSSVAVAASVAGARVQTSIVTTNGSGTNTIANVYGLLVSWGTHSSTGGGGMTLTNHYGVYISTPILTTMTITNRYGIWQDDPLASNFFTGPVGCGVAASATTALIAVASTTSKSSLRIPHGAAPSSPVNGDMWTTTAGLYIRINGATVGPLT